MSSIAEEGKLRVVADGVALSSDDVRRHFDRLRGLGAMNVRVRGWALDVLRVVRDLQQQSFNLREVYAYESYLKKLHPGNQNVRPKIRQQLQVLRNLGLIRFMARGRYEIVSWSPATHTKRAGTHM